MIGPKTEVRYNCIGCEKLQDIKHKFKYVYTCKKTDTLITLSEKPLNVHIETPRWCPFYNEKRNELTNKLLEKITKEVE